MIHTSTKLSFHIRCVLFKFSQKAYNIIAVAAVVAGKSKALCVADKKK